MSEEPKPTDSPEALAPEVLHASGGDDSDEQASGESASPVASATSTPVARRRVAYRPSHKATFIGLAVVAGVLVANAAIITFVMRNQATAEDEAAAKGVTISSSVLEGLGVSRNAVGNADTELIVGPNSKFRGKVVMGSDVNIAGQLNLNSKFTATDASLRKLDAGDTAIEKLNVNGDATISTLNLRKDLQVAGTTRLQGPLTVNQLTTINNNMNITGNLAIGGSLSVRNFQVSTLTIAGHLISSGVAPGVGAGGAVGSNGTVSISGNDTSGTVAVNAGVGAGNGLLATVTFRERYTNTPHVNVTPIGRSVPGLYVNRTSTGFSISVDGAMSPGGYAFDYIIAQ